MPDPILIDPRRGSGDACRLVGSHGPACLVPSLWQLGIEADHQHLDFGDAQLVGRSHDDRPMPMGVEIKGVSDLLQCIVDKRFVTNQLEGMLAAFEVCYLLVEGIFTCSASGELEVWDPKSGRLRRASLGSKSWTYAAVQGWITSMERVGMRIARTPDRRGSAAWLASLYHHYTVPWSEHRAHLDVRVLPLDERDLTPENPFERPEVTPKMQIAAALASRSGGVGIEKAKAAAAHFATPQDMVLAGEQEWRKVPGIGLKLARQVTAEAVRDDRRKVA